MTPKCNLILHCNRHCRRSVCVIVAFSELINHIYGIYKYEALLHQTKQTCYFVATVFNSSNRVIRRDKDAAASRQTVLADAQ